MADFVYPELAKRISETISAREEEKKWTQTSEQQQQQGSNLGSASASFSGGSGFLDSLFKKCKIESGGCSEQSALLYKGKQ